MRKILLLMLITSLILAGCTYPQSTAANPTANVLATQVSQKLTQTPNGASLTAIPSATKAGTAAPTKPAAASPTAAAAASATKAPTANPSPTATTPTAATTTPNATITATNEPGDPKTGLGTPMLKDTFQKATSWGLGSPYDDGHTRVSITPGKIIMTSVEANKWLGWRMYNARVQNFYLEVTIQTSTCAGADQYGLVFRSPDNNKGYWFGVTCDGNYTLKSGDIYDLTEIIKAKNSALIKSGSNQVNRLGVMAKGNKISLYANGKLLEDLTTDTFSGTGVFGYFITGVKTVNFTYESTELSYWNLP